MSLLEVKIPPMGESISSGILAKWHVNDGDTVAKDQPLFELETDKITSEGMAESAGKISLKVATGEEVKIGQVVATIDTAAIAGNAEPKQPSTPAGEITNPSAPTPGPPPSTASASKDATPSPAVRRLAGETGVDPATIAGTGKGGRVTKGDMLAAAAQISDSAPAKPVENTPATAPSSVPVKAPAPVNPQSAIANPPSNARQT
ncbi:MAG: biotin/lipoyl-containing protein, partial [Opitutaceae bacterium]